MITQCIAMQNAILGQNMAATRMMQASDAMLSAVAFGNSPFSFSLTIRQSLISMASLGQASLQAPQLTQSSFFTTATPSTILMASTGHSPSQEPQPTHFSLSTSAGMVFLTISFRLPPDCGPCRDTVRQFYNVTSHSR